jgi:hypothetical protein
MLAGARAIRRLPFNEEQKKDSTVSEETGSGTSQSDDSMGENLLVRLPVLSRTNARQYRQYKSTASTRRCVLAQEISLQRNGPRSESNFRPMRDYYPILFVGVRPEWKNLLFEHTARQFGGPTSQNLRAPLKKQRLPLLTFSPPALDSVGKPR